MARAKVKKSAPDFAADSASQIIRMREIIKILWREFPEATCSLDFKTPYELLMAVILSAQCTDERVNKVTPALFEKYGTAEKMAGAPLREIEKLVKTCGFFHMKAKSLKETSKILVAEYGGEVPREMEKLVELRGVGRKTANVILGVAYGIPGMVVDTHIGRIARRMGFTKQNDPVKVEFDLMAVTEKESWTDLGHLWIRHGRATCTARKAHCDECVVSRFCEKVGVPLQLKSG
jgi:endonuclease III